MSDKVDKIKDMSDIIGKELSLEDKKRIDRVVEMVVKEYGHTLMLLGR